MTSLSPSLLLAAAGALLEGARDVDGTARLAAQFLMGVGAVGPKRWSAAFVHHAGYWSHFDHAAGRSIWPLPATADCDELAAYARFRNVLSPRLPAPGDVFLLWSQTRNRFVHAGIVLMAERFGHVCSVPQRYACHTIEGNVTVAGGLGGDRLARVQRILSPLHGDRTIRWDVLGGISRAGDRARNTAA
jgi:hypothetical protein